MTLARRMWLASVALAFIVVAAFAALILAISAQRDATAREARSADVTAASLRLEKLVVDMETGIRGLTLTGEEPFLEPYTNAHPGAARPSRRACRRSSPTIRSSAGAPSRWRRGSGSTSSSRSRSSSS